MNNKQGFTVYKTFKVTVGVTVDAFDSATAARIGSRKLEGTVDNVPYLMNVEVDSIEVEEV